jgi:hypothetical protein
MFFDMLSKHLLLRLGPLVFLVLLDHNPLVREISIIHRGTLNTYQCHKTLGLLQ